MRSGGPSSRRQRRCASPNPNPNPNPNPGPNPKPNPNPNPNPNPDPDPNPNPNPNPNPSPSPSPSPGRSPDQVREPAGEPKTSQLDNATALFRLPKRKLRLGFLPYDLFPRIGDWSVLRGTALPDPSPYPYPYP